MRNFKTEGIIIKRRNYKDSDRILTVLTKTHGKIYVKAAGVRKITSRRAGHIEPLNHAILTLYKGHTFPILTEIATLNNFQALKGDLDRIGVALHLCELIDGLCPENQENMRVFDLLVKTLSRLPLEDMRTVVSEFEMQLLEILGYLSADKQKNSASFLQAFDTQDFIENILERRLKSRTIFAKMH